MSFPFQQNDFYQQAIFQSAGLEVEILDVNFQSGGCISTAAKIITNKDVFFLKWNMLDIGLFEAEAGGLKLLANSADLRIPNVYGFGKIADRQYILMEFLESIPPANDSWEMLGRELAILHSVTNNQFGLDHENFIGKLVQKNTFSKDWLSFFIQNRLEVQAGLAYYNGLVNANWLSNFQKLYPKLESFFPKEKPALLHGDLWSGNVHTGSDGYKWMIDPAVYFGHREMELAFTQLFGGFDAEFYKSYKEVFPLEPGYEERVDIYNLYPLLVHANLFGASYLSGVDRVVKRMI
ncbi:fructosamine kinase family protein [Peijinzhouia sedimentorum]